MYVVVLSSYSANDAHSCIIFFLGSLRVFISENLRGWDYLVSRLGEVWGGGLVVGWVVGGGEAPPPLLKILGVGFLVGVVTLVEFVSEFHEAFLSSASLRSMGDGSHVLATAHTSARENVLGAFLVRVIKLGVLDIPEEYPMLLYGLAEKVPVLALELGNSVSVIITICVILILYTSTSSMSV